MQGQAGGTCGPGKDTIDSPGKFSAEGLAILLGEEGEKPSVSVASAAQCDPGSSMGWMIAEVLNHEERRGGRSNKQIQETASALVRDGVRYVKNGAIDFDAVAAELDQRLDDFRKADESKERDPVGPEAEHSGSDALILRTGRIGTKVAAGPY